VDKIRNIWLLLPLIAAIAILLVFMLGLRRDDARVLPSALIDKPVPAFELPGLGDGPSFAAADLKGGGVKLINIWASWCGPCRIEHPYLVMLAAEGVTLHGINYKDQPANAAAFLAELGNPFERIGVDANGRTGIEFGVYGVPETFVINAEGRITFKHVGPILERNISKLRAAIDAAGAAE